jgi:hypothetical protein
VRSKVFWALSVGLVSVCASGLVSADAITEYSSLTTWDAMVSNVSVYNISGAAPGGEIVFGNASATFGPGTFTPGSDQGYVFNDNAYGTGLQYFADDPGQIGGQNASVNVAFNASADVTALAFTLGTYSEGDSVSILVNGLPIAPVTLSSGRPTSAFLGVTDKSGPITSITFSEGGGEMDVIGSYATARAVVAPEIDPTSAASGLTLLLGGLVVLRGRRPGQRAA